MKTLTYKQTKEMLKAVALYVLSQKDELTLIDSRIGDGDHGIGMARGMTHALSRLERYPDTTNVFDLFNRFGESLLLSMGGASGVIFGSMFMGTKNKDRCSEVLDRDTLLYIFREGLDKVKQRRSKNGR